MPIIMVLGLTMLTLLGLPGPLVSYRELGILRRLSTTPVPPSWLLAAQVVVQLCIALAGLAIVNTASVVAFGAPVPKSLGGLALSCLMAIGGLFALRAAHRRPGAGPRTVSTPSAGWPSSR